MRLVMVSANPPMGMGKRLSGETIQRLRICYSNEWSGYDPHAISSEDRFGEVDIRNGL